MKRVINITQKFIVGLLGILFVLSILPSLLSYKPDAYAIDAYRQAVKTHFGYEFNSNASTHIILVPGGLVSHIAYAPLALGLSMKGYRVSVVEAFFNLAILYPNIINHVDTASSSILVLMGHSLGGVSASLAMQSIEVDALITLASYPLRFENALGSPRLLSIRASRDGLLNIEAYTNALKHLDFEEVIIEGGNHAQFGSYGHQRNDIVATITPSQQLRLTITAIDEWLQTWLQP